MNNHELRIVVNAKDNASKLLKQVRQNLGLSAKSAALMGAVAGAAAAGVTALARATRNLAQAAVGGAADYEQHRIAFETMLGSADSARSMLQDITEFAKRTPFELPGVVQGAKQLLAYNIEQKKLLPTLEALGNIAAGVGTDKLPQLILAFGQVRAAGRLTGMELRQFTEAGVPLLDELAKVTGKTAAQIKEEMEDGAAPSFALVENALTNLSGEGGRFFNLMDRQSKTFGGIVNNIKDGFGQVLRAAVGITPAGDIVAGSVFERIKDAAERAMPAVQRAAENVGPAVQRLMERLGVLARGIGEVARQVADYLGPKLGALWKTIRYDLMPVLRTLASHYLSALVPLLGRVLVGAVGAAVDVMNAFVSALVPIAGWVSQNRGLVLGLASAFGTLWASMKAWDVIDRIRVAFHTLRIVTIPGLVASLQSLMALFATPWGAAILAASATVGVLTSAFFSNRGEADRTAEAFKRQKDAVERLMDTYDRMNDAAHDLEGAELAVERAQRQHTRAVEEFGPKSLEAREALHYLKDAKRQLEEASKDARKATREHLKAEQEYAKSGALMKAVKERTTGLQILANTLNRTIVAPPSKPVKPRTPKQRGDPAGVLDAISGRRATGGPVSAGQPYIVGERRAELFVPNTSGRIEPKVESGGTVINHLSGNFTFNTKESVDAFFNRLDKTQRLAQMGMA